MTSYHVSNLGKFGHSVPRDMNGYCHLTAEAWMAAPVDMSSEDRADADYMQEWAADMARQSREATDAANAAAAEWQTQNA